MDIIQTPHNNFFYQVMSRKHKAMVFFERYLPEKVLSRINIGNISLAESKHLSDRGVSLYNDVLYQCEFNEGQPGYLFAMCEHQSTPEVQMPLRLLEYNTATIRKHLKQTSEKFPVIVNIVLYHGRKTWNYSTAFADYYENPALGREFLDMSPFTLVNIPMLPKKEIQEDRELGFCFVAFICTSSSDPYEAFQEFFMNPIFKSHFGALSKELRNLTLTYLGNCIDREKHSLEDLANLISNNPQETTEIMTSITQAIRQEGMQEGMQQGMQQEKLHVAKNMLSNLHLDMRTVSQATGLSKEELTKLQEEA